MSKSKYDTKNAIKIFNLNGYSYLDGESKSQYSKLSVVDNDGYKYYVCIDPLINKNNCKFAKFGLNNPYTIDNINNYFKLNNIKTKPISQKWISAKTNMTWICQCGNEFNRSWNKMQQGTCLCNECAKEVMKSKQRISQSDFIEFLSKYNLKTIKENYLYKNNRSMFDCVDKNGFRFRTNLNQIKQTNGNMDIINKRNPYVIHNMNVILKNDKRINMEIITLPKDYEGDYSPVVWKCNDCGNTFNRKWNSYHCDNGVFCPYCFKENQSKIASLTQDYFESRNIYYIKEYTFDDCRDLKKLPFDFYLPKYNCCVEVNGMQHYKPVEYFGGIKKFNVQIKHDEIKNNYCINNNINIINIPYWMFNDNKYIDELDRMITNTQLCSE